VLGGLLVTDLSWRWVFYVNVPIGALAFAFGLFFVQEQATESAGRFDIRGLVLSGLGFGALMYGISEGSQRGWTNSWVLTGIVVGALTIALLIVTQLHTQEPLLRLHLFGDRLFRSVNVANFLATAAFFGA